MAKKKPLSATQKVEIAVGITAAAVAAAGTYFLYGSQDAAKNRKKVKSWMLKAKAEALDALEQAKSMSKEEYDELIESIAGSYASLKDASKGDITAFKEEMKDYWQHIEDKGKKVVSGAMKKASGGTAKKATKKSAKKTTKKAAKKSSKKTTKQSAKKTAKKATKKSTKKAE